MSEPEAARVCIVLGVGPSAGLGAALCRRFAAGGLHVVVSGRTREKLDAVVAEIEAGGGAATAVVADATEEAEVGALFDRAARLGRLEVAIYNAGNNTPGRIDAMEAEYFERAWRLCCFGGFLFGREAVRRWQGSDPGPRSLLFTGASASLRGRKGFGAFNSAKGALRNLAQAMAKEYGEDGVHVAHVVVDGGIAGDKIIKGVPKFAERVGAEGLIELDGLAEAYWFLHGQPPQAWSFELDLRTAREQW
ncbi:MAG TPA: SDR family NAD(P)-dependent oxidoreductase [Pseudomonadales bacterium]|nr:SDR family NAD(P)-dependent oxidoreductase [Pseudomonadales bacterium]